LKHTVQLTNAVCRSILLFIKPVTKRDLHPCCKLFYSNFVVPSINFNMLAKCDMFCVSQNLEISCLLENTLFRSVLGWTVDS